MLKDIPQKQLEAEYRINQLKNISEDEQNRNITFSEAQRRRKELAIKELK